MLGVFPAKSNWITGDKPLAADVDNMSALINNFNPSAKGSITVGSNPATLAELLIGSTGQLLGVVSGLPAWTAPLIDNLAWTAFIPTVTPQSGVITTSTANSAYKLIGKVCIERGTIQITNAGTGAGLLYVGLSHTAITGTFQVGSAKEVLVIGTSGNATINGSSDTTKLYLLNYLNATWIITGYAINYQITYEIA